MERRRGREGSGRSDGGCERRRRRRRSGGSAFEKDNE